MERGRISRLFHAQIDKETVASWESDLVRNLLTFNVGFVVCARLVLTVHHQAEVAINTNANTSAIYRDVTHMDTSVSNVHHGVVTTYAVVSNINTLVSDIHCNMLQNQGGADHQHRLVSMAFCQGTEHLPPSPRLKLGQQS